MIYLMHPKANAGTFCARLRVSETLGCYFRTSEDLRFNSKTKTELESVFFLPPF